MKKLTLDLDDLSVESFAVAPEDGEAGSVEAFQQVTGPVLTCSSYVCGSADTGEVQCWTNMTRCEQPTCYPNCVNME